ncbi:MAG TPA: hypothetical protein VMV78_02875 [Thiobacillus sp.]|nr:hypothetical protein [Thiobacillus sp.]
MTATGDVKIAAPVQVASLGPYTLKGIVPVGAPPPVPPSLNVALSLIAAPSATPGFVYPIAFLNVDPQKRETTTP